MTPGLPIHRLLASLTTATIAAAAAAAFSAAPPLPTKPGHKTNPAISPLSFLASLFYWMPGKEKKERAGGEAQVFINIFKSLVAGHLGLDHVPLR